MNIGSAGFYHAQLHTEDSLIQDVMEDGESVE